jgi:hypothetical protein
MRDKVHCPYCNCEADAEFVDVGVGMAQVTPYRCYNCYSYQIGTIHKETLSDKEKYTGWFEPPHIWWPEPTH